ncbi:hypothetical protein HPB52_008764 [Rhipicephalus sanguineus]|uniref:Uncharacterized protein n=1 Tax=Rhipicephalus sanguineus TaxID=34632 RepID=A0A9D4PVC4_RHISA|nr:hypothetical protein HPB52_008764 [Rhipicephalus sanguineus]
MFIRSLLTASSRSSSPGQEIPYSSFYSRKDPQTLNDNLNRVDAGKDVPSVVAILPPDSYAAAVTDEERGDEEGTSMDHLPGSTLRAEVVDSYSEASDDEDEPPAKLQKRHVKWDKRDLNSSLPVGYSSATSQHSARTTCDEQMPSQ